MLTFEELLLLFYLNLSSDSFDVPPMRNCSIASSESSLVLLLAWFGQAELGFRELPFVLDLSLLASSSVSYLSRFLELGDSFCAQSSGSQALSSPELPL